MSASRPLPTLRQVFNHVHFRVTLFAAGLTGLAVMLTGFATIAFYANQNLQLVANTTSYAVAPAVVFNDPHAVEASIVPIGRLDGVGCIRVVDRAGDTLGKWDHAPASRGLLGLNALLTRLIFPVPSRAPIVHQGQAVGTVIITGEAGPIAGYIGSGVLAALACLVITAIASHFLAQRLMRNVIRPLSAIEQVAHAVRRDRAFERRVPPADIAEINNLGDDFNALLAELDDWHHQMRRENADLSHQALHDPLTGLPNRVHFDRVVGETLEEARRRESSFAILYLDGDDFKTINDRYGHAAGDAVLRDRQAADRRHPARRSRDAFGWRRIRDPAQARQRRRHRRPDRSEFAGRAPRSRRAAVGHMRPGRAQHRRGNLPARRHGPLRADPSCRYPDVCKQAPPARRHNQQGGRTVMRLSGRLISMSLALAPAALLAGCQTLPTALGFSARQIAALRHDGFVETDRGWAFDIDDRLLFGTDQSTIQPAQIAQIGRVAGHLLEVGIHHARVEGYADSIGAAQYNETLSSHRAQAVAAAMATAGFVPQNLAVSGEGERDPVETNATAAGRQQNRRVVILIASAD